MKKTLLALTGAALLSGATLTTLGSDTDNPNLKPEWWKSAVCYEIYVRSFNDSNGDGVGDLNGITEKLDYLKNLGVDVIWITPFYPSGGVDMGYDISDYKAVDNQFGTMQDFDNLVKKAHEKGIKVLLDMVFCHTSDQHPWFKSAIESKTGPYRDYYVWAKPKKDGSAPNSWQSWFSGPAWELNKNTGDYYLHIFAKQQPALNWKNSKVRKEMFDVAKFWLDKGADGLRLDVITLIALPKLNQSSDLWGAMPKAHDYLKDFNKEVLSKYDLLTVGEMPGVNYNTASKYVGADAKQLNTIFQLDIMGGLDNKNGNKFEPTLLNLDGFKQVYRNWYNGLYGKGWNSVVLGNHDQARIVSRWGNDGIFWKESAKMLATFLLSQWGTPYIYEGEEIGMTNCPFTRDEFKDVEEINYYEQQIKSGKNPVEFMSGLLARCRDNARTPMQWDTTKNGGFSSGDKTWIKVNPNYATINAASEEKDSDSILNYYKKMIQLRKTIPALVYGTYIEVDQDNPDVFAYKRALDDKSWLIVCNFKDKESSLSISPDEIKGKKILINNYANPPKTTTSGIDLEPYQAVIYEY